MDRHHKPLSLRRLSFLVARPTSDRETQLPKEGYLFGPGPALREESDLEVGLLEVEASHEPRQVVDDSLEAKHAGGLRVELSPHSEELVLVEEGAHVLDGEAEVVFVLPYLSKIIQHLIQQRSNDGVPGDDPQEEDQRLHDVHAGLAGHPFLDVDLVRPAQHPHHDVAESGRQVQLGEVHHEPRGKEGKPKEEDGQRDCDAHLREEEVSDLVGPPLEDEEELEGGQRGEDQEEPQYSHHLSRALDEVQRHDADERSREGSSEDEELGVEVGTAAPVRDGLDQEASNRHEQEEDSRHLHSPQVSLTEPVPQEMAQD